MTTHFTDGERRFHDGVRSSVIRDLLERAFLPDDAPPEEDTEDTELIEQAFATAPDAAADTLLGLLEASYDLGYEMALHDGGHPHGH